MFKQKHLIISIIIVLIFFICIYFIKNYLFYKKNLELTKNPFTLIEILDTKIKLKENIRNYNIEADCSKITSSNDQIIYYHLKDEFKNSKVSVEAKLFNNNEIMTEDFTNLTNIDFNIIITEPKEIYEQIYHINVTCQEIIDTLGN